MPAINSTLIARGVEARDIFDLSTTHGTALTVVFSIVFVGPAIMLFGILMKRVLLRLERNRPELQDPLHRLTIHTLLYMHMETACPRCTLYRLRNIEFNVDSGSEDAQARAAKDGFELAPLPPREPEPAHLR